jgi:hypothetical protein
VRGSFFLNPEDAKVRATRYLQLNCLGLFLAPQLLLFKVAQNGRTLLIDSNRCGKTSLDLLVAELVQLFCEEVYALDGRRPPGNPTRPQSSPSPPWRELDCCRRDAVTLVHHSQASAAQLFTHGLRVLLHILTPLLRPTRAIPTAVPLLAVNPPAVSHRSASEAVPERAYQMPEPRAVPPLPRLRIPEVVQRSLCVSANEEFTYSAMPKLRDKKLGSYAAARGSASLASLRATRILTIVATRGGLQVHTISNECQLSYRTACSCDLAAAPQTSLLSKFSATVEEPE